MGFVLNDKNVDITMIQGKFKLSGPIEARLLISQMPGATIPEYDKRSVIIPATAFTAAEINEKLSLKYSLTAVDEFFQMLQTYERITDASKVLQATGDIDSLYPPKTPRWKHQKEALAFALSLQNFGCWMEMGTGKTKVLIDIFDIKEFQLILIIVPKSVGTSEVWSSEFDKHSKKKRTVLELVEGDTNYKAKVLQMYLKNYKQLVVVTNYEAAWRGKLAEIIKATKWDAITLDEAHKIKSTKTKASHFYCLLGSKIPHRYAMTGTPLADKPADVFGIYKFLDPTIFGSNFQQFANVYIGYGGYRGSQVVNYYNLPEMKRKMYSIAYRVSKDVLDLPSTMTIHRDYIMNAEAQAKYREIDRDLATEVGGEKFLITNSLVKIIRLQQLTSGYLPSNDEEHPLLRIDDGKKHLLKEVLEDLPDKEPVVIFCKFLRDLQVIQEVCTELGREYKELSGAKKENLAWQNGAGTILGVQVRSGSAGINLTRANTCIYYSIGHSLTDYEQSFSRIHRPGQTRPVKFIHLLAKHTIDYDVLQAVLDKKDIVRYIVDNIQTRRRGTVDGYAVLTDDMFVPMQKEMAAIQ